MTRFFKRLTLITALIFLSSLSCHSVSANRLDTIIVAVHIEPPAIDFVDNRFVGRNVEVARALASALGKKVTFVNCPFARCFNMMKNGQADLLIGLRMVEERKAFVSYLPTPIQIQHLPLKFYVSRSSDIEINCYQDLATLTIGVLRGGSYFEPFDQDKNLQKIAATNHKQLIDLLLKKRIDTFLEREESVHPWIDRQRFEQEFRIAHYQYDNAVASYIGLSKKSPHHKDFAKFSSALEVLVTSKAFDHLFGTIGLEQD